MLSMIASSPIVHLHFHEWQVRCDDLRLVDYDAVPQIITGKYPPLPSTRSKELRDLIDKMLTLDWQKRPSEYHACTYFVMYYMT